MHISAARSLTVEFIGEQSGTALDSAIVDAVVAFANTKGGTLYLGVEPDGMATGADASYRDVERLTTMVFNATVPPVGVRAHVVGIGAAGQAEETAGEDAGDGRDAADDDGRAYVTAIEVAESSCLTCDRQGRALRRVIAADGGPANVPMYPQDLMSRLSSLGLYDYGAQPAPCATTADLDPEARGLLRQGMSHMDANDPALGLSDADFDEALGLTVRPTPDGESVPTVAGMVMIGTQEALRRSLPNASAVVRVLHDGQTEVDETMRLPLVMLIQRIEKLLEPWNHQSEVTLGLRRVNYDDYDRGVLHEALVNAFCHRDYAMAEPVRVLLDDDGLRITNPGGFIRGVEPGNLLTVSSAPRNRRIADILGRCGYVRPASSGVERIVVRTLAAGRPLPSYAQSGADEVTLFLRHCDVDAKFVKMSGDLAARHDGHLPDIDLIVLGALNQHHALDAAGIADATGLDGDHVAAALGDLIAAGAVRGAVRSLPKPDADAGSDDGDTVRRGRPRGRRAYVYMLVRPEGEPDDDASAETVPGRKRRAFGARGRGAVDRRAISRYVRGKDGVDASPVPEAVCSFIQKSDGSVIVPDVAERFGVSNATARNLLKKLSDDGRVRHEGRTRGSRYVVA